MAEQKKVIRKAFRKLTDDDQSDIVASFSKVNPKKGFLKKPDMLNPFEAGRKHPTHNSIFAEAE